MSSAEITGSVRGGANRRLSAVDADYPHVSRATVTMCKKHPNAGAQRRRPRSSHPLSASMRIELHAPAWLRGKRLLETFKRRRTTREMSDDQWVLFVQTVEYALKEKGR